MTPRTYMTRIRRRSSVRGISMVLQADTQHMSLNAGDCSSGLQLERYLCPFIFANDHSARFVEVAGAKCTALSETFPLCNAVSADFSTPAGSWPMKRFRVIIAKTLGVSAIWKVNA